MMTRTWMAFSVVMALALGGCGPAEEPLDTGVSLESQEAALCSSGAPACEDLHGQPCDEVFSRTSCCNPSGESYCRCMGSEKLWMCYF